MTAQTPHSLAKLLFLQSLKNLL